MIKISVSLIKKLRELTNASIMDCKKELTAANGNIELAINNIRQSNIIRAENKESNLTTNGVILTKVMDHYGCILEINCQTDFVAKNIYFQRFAKKVLNMAFFDKITDITILKEKFEGERAALVATTGENINIFRIAALKGDIIGSYQHGDRIGVLISVEKANKELIKKLAMHIAASNPMFVSEKDIPIRIIEKERQMQLEIASKSGKSQEIVKQIVNGRMKKFINEISLNDQFFIMDTNKTISQLLQENGANVISFIRFEIGENIKRKTKIK